MGRAPPPESLHPRQLPAPGRTGRPARGKNHPRFRQDAVLGQRGIPAEHFPQFQGILRPRSPADAVLETPVARLWPLGEMAQRHGRRRPGHVHLPQSRNSLKANYEIREWREKDPGTEGHWAVFPSGPRVLGFIPNGHPIQILQILSILSKPPYFQSISHGDSRRFTARRSRNQRSRATKNTRSHKKGSLKWKSTNFAI